MRKTPFKKIKNFFMKIQKKLQQGSVVTWVLFILIIGSGLALLLFFKQAPNTPILKTQPSTDTTTIENPIDSNDAVTDKEDITPIDPEDVIVDPNDYQKELLDEDAITSAYESGDSSNCEKIAYNKKLKQECLDNLNYPNIIRSGNEKECKKLYDKTLRQECFDKIYFSAALDTSNLSLCNKVDSKNLREQCSNKVKLLIGSRSKDITTCESITNFVIKQDCLDEYQYTLAIDNDELSSCDSIIRPELKIKCQTIINNNQTVTALANEPTSAKIVTTTEKLLSCEHLQGESQSTCRNESNYLLAFEKKDLSYCDKITADAKKSECYHQQSENLDRFYIRQAIASHELSSCYKIINPGLKAVCLDSI